MYFRSFMTENIMQKERYARGRASCPAASWNRIIYGDKCVFKNPSLHGGSENVMDIDGDSLW